MKWVLALVALLFGLTCGFFLAPPSAGSDAGACQTSSGGDSYSDGTDDESGESVGRAGEAGEAGDPEGALAASTSGREPITAEWLATLEDLNAFDQIGALHARLKSIHPSEFPALMDQMSLIERGPLGWQVRRMIATRWAELDPKGILAFSKEKKGSMSWSLYSTIFSAWSQQDPETAYAAALQLETERAQQAAIQSVINTVSAEDPQGAIEMARDFYGDDVGRRGRWILQSIYRNWEQRDGDAARASALALEDGATKSAALTGAMSEWVTEDPAEALAWLDSLPIDSAVYSSRKEVLRNFLNQDFDVAKEYIESIENPLDRREILESLQFHDFARRKSYEEIEAVFDWIGTVATGQVYDSRVSGIIGAMAQNDPDRAVDFVLNMRPGNARMNGLSAISSQLVQRDPKLAFEFIDSLSFEDEKLRALGNMGWQLSQQGVESASSLVSEHADPLVQQQLAARLSGEWSNYDIEAARIWSESLSDEQARKASLRAVINNWIESDPAATLDYVENSLETNDRGSVLSSAYGNWARNDPEAAVQWLDRLPESLEAVKGDVYNSVANNYIRHDPLAASEWIATIDEGPERDQSVEALVNNIARSDPEASFIWAATVGDANRRSNTLRRSVHEWIQTDPEAAYEAIVDAEIEAAEKEPLLQMLEGKR